MEVDQDVIYELITAWSCLDNIRLEALPSFISLLEVIPQELEFPSTIEEIKNYKNELRAKGLEIQANEALMLAERTKTAMEAFSSFSTIIIMQCQEKSIPIHSIEQYLEEPVYNMLIECASKARNANQADPLRDYRKMEINLQIAASQASILSMLYKNTIEDVSKLIYEYLVPSEIKNLNMNNKINWIAVHSCIRKLIVLESVLNIFSHSKYGKQTWFFSPSEGQFLIEKLQIIIEYIFNILSRSINASKIVESNLKQSSEIDPTSQPNPESNISPNSNDVLEAADESIAEMPIGISSIFLILRLFSPQTISNSEVQWITNNEFYESMSLDVNMQCFRDLICQVAHKRIIQVAGDGNCFYRAILKFFFPNIHGNTETTLSDNLRQKLNEKGILLKKEKSEMKESLSQNQSTQNNDPSSENSTQNKDIENSEYQNMEMNQDPYEGWTIDKLNDPETMSISGVWADHLQVKKMADFMRRPIWIFRYDDEEIKIKAIQKRDQINEKCTIEFEISPGMQYKIQPAPVTNAFDNVSNTPIENIIGRHLKPSGGKNGQKSENEENSTTRSTNPSLSDETNKKVPTLLPVTLYFTPEVHYDVLTSAQQLLTFSSLDDLSAFCTDPTITTARKAHNIAHWYFELEYEMEKLFSTYRLLFLGSGALSETPSSSSASIDHNSRQNSIETKRTEVGFRSLSLLRNLTCYTNALASLKAEQPDFALHATTSPGGIIAGLAIQNILQDTLILKEVLLEWDNIKKSLFSEESRIVSYAEGISPEHPISSIFLKLCSIFESLVGTDVPKHIQNRVESKGGRSDLTESQAGAAWLLAALRSNYNYDEPPPFKKSKLE